MRRKIQYQVLIPKGTWKMYSERHFMFFFFDRYSTESDSSIIINILCELAATQEAEACFKEVNEDINKDFGTSDISYFRVIKSEVIEIELTK